MLDDTHLKVEYYEQDSSKVFPGTDIKGGIAVTYRNTKENYGPIGVFSYMKEVNAILTKVLNTKFDSFNQLLFGKSSYKFTKKLYENHPELNNKVSKSERKSISSNILDKIPEVFFDDKQVCGCDQIRILLREKNKRVYKWINRDYVEQHPNLDKYKVILPATNGNGDFGETVSTPIIGEPGVGHSQTFISFGEFDSELEASNAMKYIKTKFLRTLLGTMKVTQHNQTKEAWKNIPYQNFRENSDINWEESLENIDQQLYEKYNFSLEEIDFIEKTVKSMS